MFGDPVPPCRTKYTKLSSGSSGQLGGGSEKHEIYATEFGGHLFTACKRSLRRLCFSRCVSVHRGVLSQHALQVVSHHALQQVSGGDIPACLAGFQACTQGGSLGGSGWGEGLQAHTQGEVEGDLVQADSQGRSWGGSGPGPHPRGKLWGSWGVPAPKGVPALEDAWSRGCLLPRGCLLWRMPDPGGACSGVCVLRGCVETSPLRLLLRSVRILLECILVYYILFTGPDPLLKLEDWKCKPNFLQSRS